MMDNEESPRNLSTQRSILESQTNQILVSKIQDLKMLMKQEELFDSTKDIIEHSKPNNNFRESKEKDEESTENMHSNDLNSLGKEIIDQIYKTQKFQLNICQNITYSKEKINFKNRSRSIINKKSKSNSKE
jgi:hypothetical protein